MRNIKEGLFTPSHMFALMQSANEKVVPGMCDTPDCLAKIINQELQRWLLEQKVVTIDGVEGYLIEKLS